MYIFSYRAFPAEHDGDIYSYVQQFLQKLEAHLKPHVSPFIHPPPLSCTITIYSVLWNKTEYKKKERKDDHVLIKKKKKKFEW